MKVYELMAVLNKAPAGAEVEFRTIMDTSELQSFPVVGMVEEAEGNYYSVAAFVADAEVISDKVVAVYK